METPKSINPHRSFRRRKQLEQDLAHVTQEMYRRNLELAETNKTLSLLRKIDELVLESHDTLEVLCNQITSAIATTGEYPLVALLAYAPHNPTALRLFGLSTDKLLPKEQLALCKKLSISAEQPWINSEATSTLVEVKDTIQPQLASALNCSATQFSMLHRYIPVRSVFIIKLTARKNLVGIMAIGLSQAIELFMPKDQQLFERLGQAVGVAVDNKLLFEEKQQVVRQLQKTNDKLKALDEAKDEFISMASHQLRTPLTSVKGYVSMVLDGDAGKVNNAQRKLLDQAFASSQRMVYLIADLLNVSRLKTGKFVIEAKPVNLAEVVENEISQLIHAARAKNIELTFKKPAETPLLLLDETKIRQVIMNFIDNAIYYTPAGGHIKVSLSNKGSAIEFTVVDDGIGVPKGDQHQLFTKFYRAANARNARPDGTGLGLFMAKKVVVAQGGAIIFNSQEGKGSTFGFTFATSKLKAD